MTQTTTILESSSPEFSSTSHPLYDTASPSLISFICELTHKFKSKKGATVDPEELKCMVESLGGHELPFEDLKPFCLFDEETRYTRNLIWENEYFSLLLLCWSPKQESCIHAHAGSQCWARCVLGELTEVFYDADPYQDLKNTLPSKFTTLHPGKACYIDDGMGVHKIQNNTNEFCVSMHLYAPAYKTCAFFHPVSGKRIIGEITYHTEFGKRVHKEFPPCCKRERSGSLGNNSSSV